MFVNINKSPQKSIAIKPLSGHFKLRKSRLNHRNKRGAIYRRAVMCNNIREDLSVEIIFIEDISFFLQRDPG